MEFKKIKIYAELVMLSHTLFSLPFALISMFWAAKGLPSLDIIFWILIALFGARNGANALNRWVDRDIDKRNPRTENRHLPKGRVSGVEVWGIILFCLGIFIYAAYKLNPLCFWLTPFAIFLFAVYSYTKRFTWACHLVLGFTCAGAPIGAWIAVTGRISPIPFVLGAAVMLWVSGFDIIYGTQDIEFDRKNNIFSIPAIFGLKEALWISRIFHFVMILLLMGLYFVMNMGWIYLCGILISAVLLCVEHYMVFPSDRKKMDIASYNINQLVSILIFIFTSADMFLYEL